MLLHKKLLAKRCHHVALEVSDMDAAIEFYRDFIGMRLTERHAAGENRNIPVELAFLRLHQHHHDLVLAHDPKRQYTQKDNRSAPPGIHHYAFECPDRESFQAYLDEANARGMEIVRGPVLHSAMQPGGDGSWGENESFYVLDPDGHRVELFCDMATINSDGQFVTVDNKIVPGTVADEL
jgi:catechol 2,3-dioxygenase-like lactoylglutathione lyase family enzyme